MSGRSGYRKDVPAGYTAPMTRHGKGKETVDDASAKTEPFLRKSTGKGKSKATENKGKGKAVTPGDDPSDDSSDDSSSESEDEVEVKPGNRFQINRVAGAPSAETELPWPHMTDMSIEELLVYYPNHVFTWPGLTLLVVQVYWRSTQGKKWLKRLSNIINAGRGLTGAAALSGNQIRGYLKLSMSKAMGVEYDFKIDTHDVLMQQLIDRADGISDIREFINRALTEKPHWIGTTTWLPALHLDAVGASVEQHSDGNFTDRITASLTSGTMVPAPTLAPAELYSFVQALPVDAAYLRQQTLSYDTYPTHIHPIDILKYHHQDLKGEVLLYVLKTFEMGKVRDVWMRHLGLTEEKSIRTKFAALRKRRETALLQRANRLGTDFKAVTMDYVLEVTAYGHVVLLPLPHATKEQIEQWAASNPNKRQVHAFFKRQAKVKKDTKTANAAAGEAVDESSDEEMPETAKAASDTKADRDNTVIQTAAKESAFWKAVIGPTGTYPETLLPAELTLQAAQYATDRKIIPPPMPALDGSGRLVAPTDLPTSVFAGATVNGGKDKRDLVKKTIGKSSEDSPAKTKTSRSKSKSKVKTESSVAIGNADPKPFTASDEPRIWSATDGAWRYADANGHFTLLEPLGAAEAASSSSHAGPNTTVSETLIDPELLRGLGEVAAFNLARSPVPTPASPFVPATPVVRLVTTIDGRAAIVPTGTTAGEVDPAHDPTGRLYQLVTIDGAGVLVARYVNEAPLHVSVADLDIDYEAVAFRLTAQEALAIDRVPAMTAAELAAFELIPTEDLLNIRFDHAARRSAAIEAAAAAAYINTDFEDAAGESIVPTGDDDMPDGSGGDAPSEGEIPSEGDDEQESSSSSSSSSSEEFSSGSTHTNSDNDNDSDDSEVQWRAGEYYQSLLTGLPTDSELPDQPDSPVSDPSTEFDVPAPAPAAEPVGAYDHYEYGEYEHATLLTAGTGLTETVAPPTPVARVAPVIPFPPADARVEWFAAESARLEAEGRAGGFLASPPPAAPPVLTSALPIQTANRAEDAIARIKRKRSPEPETEAGPSSTTKRARTTPIAPLATSSAPAAAAVTTPTSTRTTTIEPILLPPAISAVDRTIILRSSPPTAVSAAPAPTVDESTLTAMDAGEQSGIIIEEMLDLALSDLEASSEDEVMVDV